MQVFSHSCIIQMNYTIYSEIVGKGSLKRHLVTTCFVCASV